jgi:hypothetical protein
MSLKKIIDSKPKNLAFLVGNGINRYQDKGTAISWEDLLINVWNKFSSKKIDKIPDGISITEFYDLLDIETSNLTATNSKIQKEICKMLKKSKYSIYHSKFLQKAKQLNSPVLTTNFDLNLPNSLQLKSFKDDSSLKYYPWTVYYSNEKLEYPTKCFGIWYINGYINSYLSLRLGLSHYMGSVGKARKSLYREVDDTGLFKCKDIEQWYGRNTWLDIFFKKSLCIFGLALNENEVFIRWLLIERAKYFNKFPKMKKDIKSYYIFNKNKDCDNNFEGRKNFLEKIGFEMIGVEDYDDIYKFPWE